MTTSTLTRRTDPPGPAPNLPASRGADPRRALAARWYDDPVAFASEVLGLDLWPAQRDIARAVRTSPRVVCRSCHAAGKTFLAAVVVLWFLYTRRDAQILTTASTHRQVRYVLWRSIQKLAVSAPIPLGGELRETEIRLAESWYALGLSTNHPERFQGFHAPHILVVIDEPGAVPLPVFAAIEGVLASGDTRLLMIGNPTQSHGPFYDAFHAQAHEYRTFRISAFDTPNLTHPNANEDHPPARPYLISRAWVDQRRRMWGEDSDLYRSRVLAQFPRAASNQLFPLALLEAACTNAPAAPPARVQRTALGVDVARFGSDATAFSRIEDGVLRFQLELHDIDTMAICGHVMSALHDCPDLLVAVDDTGVGGGVTDRLRELGVEPLACNFGARAGESRYYANRGTEIYARLADALRDGHLTLPAALPTHDHLSAQLTQVRVDFTSDGRRRVRKRDPHDSAPSPDLADSLALAWAAYEDGTKGPAIW